MGNRLFLMHSMTGRGSFLLATVLEGPAQGNVSCCGTQHRSGRRNCLRSGGSICLLWPL